MGRLKSRREPAPPRWTRPRIAPGDMVTYVGHTKVFPAVVVRLNGDDSAELVAFTANPEDPTEGCLGVRYDPTGALPYSWHQRKIR